MANAEHRNRADAFLRKAEEYLASAAANRAANRNTPAAGDAIHAGICAKDAIATMLTGNTAKTPSHATAARELQRTLGRRPEAASAAKKLAELIAAKSDVEYGSSIVTAKKAESHISRAGWLVDLAVRIVRLGG